MKKHSIFIGGTDTGIGKTVVSAMLLTAAKNLISSPTGYFKPIQTGDESDTQSVTYLASLSDGERIDPAYTFLQPSAPVRAAAAENKVIDLTHIQRVWEQLPERNYVVEGAGGLLVPITTKQTFRDLIRLLALPLVIVASTRLGTINHTLLTIEVAIKSGIEVAGIVLVGQSDPGLIQTLSNFTNVPILAEVPFLPEITPKIIEQISRNIFTSEVFERLFR